MVLLVSAKLAWEQHQVWKALTQSAQKAELSARQKVAVSESLRQRLQNVSAQKPLSIEMATTSLLTQMFALQTTYGLQVTQLQTLHASGSNQMQAISAMAEQTKFGLKKISLNVKGQYTSLLEFQQWVEALITMGLSVPSIKVDREGFEMKVVVYGL